MNKGLLYAGISLLMLCSGDLSAQSNPNPYLPMQIGNRWDYLVTYWVYSGEISYDTLSVIITADTIINNREYSVFSSPIFYDYNNDWQLLRLENDSLYCFSSADSQDCLISAFNQRQGYYYNCCRYDSLFFYEETYSSLFGVPDTQQSQSSYSTGFYFSKKFGITDIYYLILPDEIKYTLRGCIISGITYGELLTGTKCTVDNKPSFQLNQNYPNPFNPETIISFTIPKRSMIRLSVYDILGREIKSLIKNELKDAGRYEVTFDGTNFPSGIYLYNLEANGKIKTGKMILIK